MEYGDHMLYFFGPRRKPCNARGGACVEPNHLSAAWLLRAAGNAGIVPHAGIAP